MSKINNPRTGSAIKQPTQQNTERLADNSVASNHIQDLAVTTSKFDDNVISTAKVQDLAITAAKVASDVATTAGVQDLSGKTFTDAVTMQEVTTPSTPAAGDNKIYAKTDGKVYSIDDVGTENVLNSPDTVFRTTSYTVTQNDGSILCANTGTITITLPDASVFQGPLIIARRSGATITDHREVQIAPSGGAAIDNIIANRVLFNEGDSITLVTDGTDWFTQASSFRHEVIDTSGGVVLITTTGTWQNLGSVLLGRGKWILNIDAGFETTGATNYDVAISTSSGSAVPNTLGTNVAKGECYPTTTNASVSLQNYEVTVAGVATSYYAIINPVVGSALSTDYWRLTAVRVDGNF